MLIDKGHIVNKFHNVYEAISLEIIQALLPIMNIQILYSQILKEIIKKIMIFNWENKSKKLIKNLSKISKIYPKFQNLSIFSKFIGMRDFGAQALKQNNEKRNIPANL